MRQINAHRRSSSSDLIMDRLDWNAIWRLEKENHRNSKRGPEFWDRRAASFSRHASKAEDYIFQLIGIMKPEPHWRILDIGCAAGTLAVPLSKIVHSITAVDYSANMLTLLGERCEENQISNIRIVHGSWDDDWELLGIGEHDVALASRSLVGSDLARSISKLNRFALKRVYLSLMVGDGPFDRALIEAVGRTRHPMPDYIYVYNYLHQIGIHANVSFTIEKEVKRFETLGQAVASLSWMIDEPTPKEIQRLREYLSKKLVIKDGWMQMPEKRIIRWAVVWWDKETEASSTHDD